MGSTTTLLRELWLREQFLIQKLPQDTPEIFDELLDKVQPAIQKYHTNFEETPVCSSKACCHSMLSDYGGELQVTTMSLSVIFTFRVTIPQICHTSAGSGGW